MIHLITDFISAFFPLVSGILAMLSAQILKMALISIRHQALDTSPFTGSGGMPSSHTAMVTALTCAIGLQIGWNSPTFAVSTVFSLIVLHDAAGVRYAAGKQASVLNKVQAIVSKETQLESQELEESLGHNKVEIAVGVLLGLAVSFGLYYLII